jgi:hypothetical protein
MTTGVKVRCKCTNTLTPPHRTPQPQKIVNSIKIPLLYASPRDMSAPRKKTLFRPPRRSPEGDSAAATSAAAAGAFPRASSAWLPPEPDAGGLADGKEGGGWALLPPSLPVSSCGGYGAVAGTLAGAAAGTGQGGSRSPTPGSPMLCKAVPCSCSAASSAAGRQWRLGAAPSPGSDGPWAVSAGATAGRAWEDTGRHTRRRWRIRAQRPCRRGPSPDLAVLQLNLAEPVLASSIWLRARRPSLQS